MLVVYGAVCSDDMTTACADTDCTAPATCVLKPTDRQGYLRGPEPMHTRTGRSATTGRPTQTFTGSAPPGRLLRPVLLRDRRAGVAYFEDCTTLYPSGVVVDDRDVRHE